MTKVYSCLSNSTKEIYVEHDDYGSLKTVVYFHGYKSDSKATKALALKSFCKNQKISYLSFDLCGHGKSSLDLKEATLSLWVKNAKDVLEKHTTNDLILVGSSLGAWVSLLYALKNPARVKGFIGIAPAVDFVEDLLKICSQDQIQTQGGIQTNTGTWLYQDFLKDSQKHNCLKNLKKLNFPVHILYGGQDKSVPLSLILNIMDAFSHVNPIMTYVQQGDHRLNDEVSLKELKRVVALFSKG